MFPSSNDQNPRRTTTSREIPPPPPPPLPPPLPLPPPPQDQERDGHNKAPRSIDAERSNNIVNAVPSGSVTTKRSTSTTTNTTDSFGMPVAAAAAAASSSSTLGAESQETTRVAPATAPASEAAAKTTSARGRVGTADDASSTVEQSSFRDKRQLVTSGEEEGTGTSTSTSSQVNTTTGPTTPARIAPALKDLPKRPTTAAAPGTSTTTTSTSSFVPSQVHPRRLRRSGRPKPLRPPLSERNVGFSSPGSVSDSAVTCSSGVVDKDSFVVSSKNTTSTLASESGAETGTVASSLMSPSSLDLRSAAKGSPPSGGEQTDYDRAVVRPADSLSTDDKHGLFVLKTIQQLMSRQEQERRRRPERSPADEPNRHRHHLLLLPNTFTAEYGPKEAVFNDNDIKRHIFCYVSSEDLINTRTVSKPWNCWSLRMLQDDDHPKKPITDNDELRRSIAYYSGYPWRNHFPTRLIEFWTKCIYGFKIGKWNVSQVTNFSKACRDLVCFNEPLEWDTRNATNMSEMFRGCKAFNSSLGPFFNTSNVTNMAKMFSGCKVFNSSLGPFFNTSNVTNMSEMFHGCKVFNQDLSHFDTSKVISMSWMISECHAFNQDLSHFDTSKVTNMSWMFFNATKFNGSLESFDTSNVLSMDGMLHCTIFAELSERERTELLTVTWGWNLSKLRRPKHCIIFDLLG